MANQNNTINPAPGRGHRLTRFSYGLIELICVYPCKHKTSTRHHINVAPQTSAREHLLYLVKVIYLRTLCVMSSVEYPADKECKFPVIYFGNYEITDN